MKIVSISLALVFVGLAAFNVIAAMESFRPAHSPLKRARALALHRIGGYLFIGLFAVMLWFMSKRLIGATEELSGDVILHIALAILLAPLLFVKVLIARRYKSHHAALLPLGLSIFAISALLVFIRVLPLALGLINLQSSAVKYSFVPLVLFCAFLAKLALRPTSSSPSLPTSRPFLEHKTKTFSLELISVEKQTHDAKTLRFRPQDVKDLQAKPGQFLTFHLNIDGNKVVRCYSICSSPLQTGYIEITPKRMENGCASVFLNESAKPGLIVNASGPSGQFYFDEVKHAEIVLIAGGSGITPMMAMLRYIEDRDLKARVTLIYCVRTPEDIIFQRELIRLKHSLDNFRCVITVSTANGLWDGKKGRLSRVLLHEQVPDFRVPNFFLCGPKPFMQLAAELLKERGVSGDRIRQESFGGKSPVLIPSAEVDASSDKVHFVRSGRSCGLIPNMTLLELAETVGVSIPYSCRQGQCGTCTTRLLKGSVTMSAEDGLSLEQKQAGFILPCVSKVNGNGSVSIDA